ncbi:DUF2306 domain-containing protein [Spongiivirga sp. MCCC 1A20706]|uniref:DUF2306 domain-containing protein n=1 Tax=Spongiivirga sp. MCCC 1A20706 TaxID=3160963 RepID=UPI003977CD4F
MNKLITKILIGISVLLIIFALSESIGRISDLQLAKDNPEVFEPDSHDLHYAENPLIMYIHVIAGMIFLLTGSFQLIPYLRKKFIHIHRFVGKIFLAISFIVSISAISLAVLFPFGDILETISNLIFGIYILYATVRGYTTIRAKNVTEHSYWVRRIFFLSLSIATIRLIMIAGIIINGLSVKEVMGISFLIGFLLHYIIIELWISKQRKLKYNKASG